MISNKYSLLFVFNMSYHISSIIQGICTQNDIMYYINNQCYLYVGDYNCKQLCTYGCLIWYYKMICVHRFNHYDDM